MRGSGEGPSQRRSHPHHRWDEFELTHVKAAAERTKGIAPRILRDQLYPVKVDNACRTTVLDENRDW